MNKLLHLPLAVLVVFFQGLPVEPRSVAPASSPNDLQITTYGDDKTAWFTLKWNEAISDESDPVIGYKMKVWEVKKIKKIVHFYENGKYQEKEVETYPDLKQNEDPNDEVTIIDVPANTTEAVYNNMKIGVPYEVGVQAYTAKELRPFASKMRVTLNDA